MNRKVIASPSAPPAIGPYSQGIRSGDLLFLSGQLALSGDSGELTRGGIEEQTEQVMRNIMAVLASEGLDLSAVLKTTVFLADLNHFAGMNKVYGRFFAHEPPARSTVQVARLPKDALVEIEVIARAQA